MSSPQPPQAACADHTEVGLFWDYENLTVPRGHDAAEVSNRLRTLSLRFGLLAERRVYHDPCKTASVAPQDRSKLDSAGFTLVECPTRNEKETVDKKIIVDVMHFAITRTAKGQPACVVLLTNDGDYAYMLSRLRDLQVKVVVVYMAGHAADALLHACDHAVSWRGDVLGTSGSGGSPPPGTAEAHFADAHGHSPHTPHALHALHAPHALQALHDPHGPHGAEVGVGAHAAVKANTAAKAALKASARSGPSSARAEAQRVRRQGERAAIRKAAAPARPARPGLLRRGAHAVAGASRSKTSGKPTKAARRELGDFGGSGGEWSHGVDEWRNVDAWLDAWQETGGKAGGQRKAAKAAQKNRAKKLRRQVDAGDDSDESDGDGYSPPAGAASWGGYMPLGRGDAGGGGWAEMEASPWAMRHGTKRAAKAARNGARVGTGMKKKQKKPAHGKASGAKKKPLRKGGKKKGW